MALWRTRFGKGWRFSRGGQYEDVIADVSRLIESNPDLVQGYLVVGVMVDGSIQVVHNACCMPHIVSQVSRIMCRRPELLAPRYEHSEGEAK